MSQIQLRASGSRPRTLAASEFRFNPARGYSHRGGEMAVGANGEINASSKKDLLNQQQRFLMAASARDVGMDDIVAEQETNRVLIQAAWNDSGKHRVLGERIADSLYQTANRQGFARKYLAKVPVQQGSIIRFPLRKKDVTAFYSTSPTKIESTITRDKWFTPPELTIIARPFITQNELNQSAGDVLAEKYLEATEAIMVAEDRLWYKLVQQTINMDNNLSVISGQLTPYTLSQVRTNVTRWGLKAPHVLIASDIYNDIIGNSDFFQAIDPVARHELLLTGEIGTLYGMTVTSDAYRHEEHKVLNQGEFFVISEQINHGAYADRDSLKSQPTDISLEKIPGRGWVLDESFAIAIANARSVAKGIRV